jgi:hypothetical protein
MIKRILFAVLKQCFPVLKFWAIILWAAIGPVLAWLIGSYAENHVFRGMKVVGVVFLVLVILSVCYRTLWLYGEDFADWELRQLR